MLLCYREPCDQIQECKFGQKLGLLAIVFKQWLVFEGVRFVYCGFNDAVKPWLSF